MRLFAFCWQVASFLFPKNAEIDSGSSIELSARVMECMFYFCSNSYQWAKPCTETSKTRKFFELTERANDPPDITHWLFCSRRALEVRSLFGQWLRLRLSTCSFVKLTLCFYSIYFSLKILHLLLVVASALLSRKQTRCSYRQVRLCNDCVSLALFNIWKCF